MSTLAYQILKVQREKHYSKKCLLPSAHSPRSAHLRDGLHKLLKKGGLSSKSGAGR